MNIADMRTSFSIDEDIEAAVRELRKSEGMGVSEAVNTLARRGLSTAPPSDYEFISPIFELHAKLDFSNTAEVLDILDGHWGR